MKVLILETASGMFGSIGSPHLMHAIAFATASSLMLLSVAASCQLLHFSRRTLVCGGEEKPTKKGEDGGAIGDEEIPVQCTSHTGEEATCNKGPNKAHDSLCEVRIASGSGIKNHDENKAEMPDHASSDAGMAINEARMHEEIGDMDMAIAVYQQAVMICHRAGRRDCQEAAMTWANLPRRGPASRGRWSSAAGFTAARSTR